MTDNTKITIPPQETEKQANEKLLKTLNYNASGVKQAKMYVYEKGGKNE